uniref:Uncharacterized protein n=1 Tax=Gorilla gorilla gorilla TaxID=9595 RepID=A0A2I2ZN70_GORGO
MLPRLVLNSSAEMSLPPRPPKVLGLHASPVPQYCLLSPAQPPQLPALASLPGLPHPSLWVPESVPGAVCPLGEPLVWTRK